MNNKPQAIFVERGEPYISLGVGTGEILEHLGISDNDNVSMQKVGRTMKRGREYDAYNINNKRVNIETPLDSVAQSAQKVMAEKAIQVAKEKSYRKSKGYPTDQERYALYRSSGIIPFTKKY